MIYLVGAHGPPPPQSSIQTSSRICKWWPQAENMKKKKKVVLNPFSMVHLYFIFWVAWGQAKPDSMFNISAHNFGQTLLHSEFRLNICLIKSTFDFGETEECFRRSRHVWSIKILAPWLWVHSTGQFLISQAKKLRTVETVGCSRWFNLLVSDIQVRLGFCPLPTFGMCPLLRKSEEKNASWKIMKEEKNWLSMQKSLLLLR